MLPEEIRIKILERLRRRRLWGGKHTSIDNIPKGFPPHLHKRVLKEAYSLIKQGLITAKPTFYGLEVSLNPNFAKEIDEIVRRYKFQSLKLED